MKSRRTFGYSLMEVLVAMLVLSAGMIGAAGLQLSAWQLSQQSFFHTSAQQLAAEMAEWMQAFSDLPDKLENWEVGAGSASPGTGKHCYGVHCTADELAQFITADWTGRLQSLLPDAQARLCRDGTPWDSAASAYRWSCSGNDTAPLVIKIGWLDKQDLDQAIRPWVVMSTGAR